MLCVETCCPTGRTGYCKSKHFLFPRKQQCKSYKIGAIISGEIQHTYLPTQKKIKKIKKMEIVSATSVTTISRGKVHKNFKRYKQDNLMNLQCSQSNGEKKHRAEWCNQCYAFALWMVSWIWIRTGIYPWNSDQRIKEKKTKEKKRYGNLKWRLSWKFGLWINFSF